MRSRSPRYRVLAVSAMLLTGVGCGRTEEQTQAKAPVPSGEVRIDEHSPRYAFITVEPVRSRTDKVVAVLPAQLVMDEDHTVRIASPVTGRILQLLVQAGDRIAANQALATITSGDAAQASSDLMRARAAASLAATALHRAEDLYAHHVIALKDLEQARSDDSQARAELDRAGARARQLGTGSSSGGTFVLRSPIAGEVVERTANPGAEVRPDASAPLFTVSNLGVLWLTAAVYQRDLVHVRRGQRLAFTTDAVPGQRFDGTVSYVGDALDPQTRTLTVRATLQNAAHLLRPQTFGEARLLAHADGDLPAIPTTALVTHGANTSVFVQVAPGRFTRRIVTVVDDDGTTASIASGLRVGERVVTRGSILLAGEADASGTP